MPGCCVDQCKNRSEKGFRLFRLPSGNKNSERRLEWLKLIGKTTLPERAVICEAHFGKDQFENKRKDERKLLRPCAKPNLLEKGTVEQEEQSKEDTVLILEDSSMDDIELHDNDQNTTNTNGTSSCSNSDKIRTNNDTDVTTNSEANKKNALRKATLKSKKYERDFKKLNTILKRTMQQSNILKKKLRQKENLEIFNAVVYNKVVHNFMSGQRIRFKLSYHGYT